MSKKIEKYYERLNDEIEEKSSEESTTNIDKRTLRLLMIIQNEILKYLKKQA